MDTRSSSRLVALGAAAILFVGCSSGARGTSAPPVAVGGAGLDEVVRLDEYPLYSLRMTGSYGFDDYLRRGLSAGTAGVPSANSSMRPRWGCTCFATANAQEGPVFGRNFDYYNRASLLLHTSPPGAFASISMVDLSNVGFSSNVTLEELRAQGARLAQAPYYPLDGVNEKGVAIGLLAVPSALPPSDPSKVTLYDLALIRLVLDYATDADHAVQLLQSYNYRPGSEPVHFLIADRSGQSVLVEYVDHELKAIRSAEPYMVATNFVVDGSEAPLSTSCPRYNRVYATLHERSGVLSSSDAMNLLASVTQGITMWSIVYDLRTGSATVAMGARYQSVYRTSLAP